MKTKVVFNDIIPFRGFLAMCLWPFIFVRNSAVSHYNTTVNNHEQIHAQQQKEMLILPFLIWYSIEWLCRLAQYRNSNKAYRNISFEREAYANVIYNNVNGIAALTLAQKIYKSEGETEYDEREIKTLTEVVDNICFAAIVDAYHKIIDNN